MKKAHFIFILTFWYTFFMNAQISDFKIKFNLPTEVKETSGLLFYKGKIITHNDSGDGTHLYEIDSLNGNLLRTINVSNANHIDWEDITEDETHIYIGDFGNNKGNRTDLKIYKILKTDFENNDAVNAEVITFSYEDQTDFTIQTNAHNFDAEAIAIENNSIYIFTKNWSDLKTNVYKIPTLSGNYTATKVSSANIEGLITGATFINGNYYLCGYNTSAIPFVVFVGFNRTSNDDIFSEGFDKYFLTTELGFGNQVEGITSFDVNRFYLSREQVNNPLINLNQALFEFTDFRANLLSIKENKLIQLAIYPNPSQNKITVKSQKEILKVHIYDVLGKNISSNLTPQKEIDISSLSKGLLIIDIEFKDKSMARRKLIKL